MVYYTKILTKVWGSSNWTVVKSSHHVSTEQPQAVSTATTMSRLFDTQVKSITALLPATQHRAVCAL